MKSSDRPEISKKWWCAEKPGDVKGSELEKALAAAEKALSEEQKRCDKASIGACLTALADLSAAVDKTIKKELDKKKHKDPITVLGKFEGLIGGEVKRLEAAQTKLAEGGDEKDEEGEEDEEDEGKLFQPDYLYKMIKVLRSSGKELKFGFGLNKETPEASRLLLARKGKPEKLFRALKQTGEFSNRLLMCGYALPDPANAKVLTFRLEEGANEPPQILKLGRRFLRADKNLRFRKLKLVLPGGQTLEDTDPDTEEDEAPVASGGRTPPVEAATRATADEAQSPENLRKEFKQARKRWVEVRAQAERDLEIVKDGVRDHYMDDLEQFPIAMDKLRELDEIMDNLNDDLRDALDAYVSTPLNQQARLRELGASARGLLDTFANYVDQSKLLAAIDQREFADVQIQSPMAKAMRDLARTIK